jgi:RNA polymerase sigma-70 factor (ECF subfamily)
MQNDPLYDSIRRYASRLLSDAEAGKDIVQEVFLRLQTAKADNLRAFAYRTARNLVINQYRKKKTGSLPDDLPAAATMFNPAMVAEKKETLQMIEEKINALSARHREVLRLKFQEGLKYAEIAEVLGESVTTIAWLIHEALAKLRKELAEP